MQMKEFDREFVERTKWIIQNVKCPYEATLLLNCMLGLVNLPTERAKTADNTEDFQDACVQKLEEMGVIKRRNDRLFYSPRNAMSHMHIELVNKNGEIKSAILSDRKPGSNYEHTRLEFTVDQLWEFALFVADKHLERLDKAQNKQN